MTIVRIVVVLALIGYAGWMAWPLVSPFVEGATLSVAAERARATAEGSGGFVQAALRVGALLLYLIAALILAAGKSHAAVAYFPGFLADAILRLAIDRFPGASIQAEGVPVSGEFAGRPAEALWAATGGGLPLDPTWLILGVLLAGGVLVVVLSQRRGRHRGSDGCAA